MDKIGVSSVVIHKYTKHPPTPIIAGTGALQTVTS